jgi:hypothetical protein
MPTPKKSQLRIEVESRGVNFQTYLSRIKRGCTHESAMKATLDRNPKLTPNDVQNIKALLSERDRLMDDLMKVSIKAIADKMGVSKQIIIGINNGRLHKHIYAERKP